jgi:hypothetical protein
MESFGGRAFEPDEWDAAALEKLGEARVFESEAQGRSMSLDAAIDHASERLLGERTTLRP